MAKKISQLTQATEVKSDDVTVIVQDGETKKLPLNMMVTKQDIENKKVTGLAKLDEIEATYENDTYTPTITVKNKSSVKVGEGDGVDYSANVMDGSAKSAILKGQTLVNICKPFEFDIQTTGSGLRHLKDNVNMLNIPLDDNKKYSVWVEIDINEIGAFSVSYTGAVASLVFDSIMNLTLTGGSVVVYPCVKRKDSNNINFTIGAMPGSTEGRLKGRIMVFEGDIRGFELSYFTGMQSVKMPVLTTTGKNLYNKSPFNGYIDASSGKFVSSSTTRKISDYIEVEPNKKYKVSGCTMTTMWGYDKDKNPISAINIYDITTTSDMRFIAFTINAEVEHSNIQLEEGTVATSYEPYKSNILSTSEDVTLRGIGEVQDTLDCLTGEVTERIGEIVLDGSEEWNLSGRTSETVLCVYIETGINPEKIMSDFPLNDPLQDNTKEGLTLNGSIRLGVFKNKLETADVSGMKKFLNENNIKIQYTLDKESVKTVDLMPSGTHPSTTPYCWKNGHIQLSSSGLLPNLEYSVVTSRAGQINQNATMIVKNDKRIFDLEILLAGGLVNTTYQALTLQNQVETGLSKVSLNSETEPDYLLYHMIMKLIEEKAYKLDDLTEKVSVFYLYEKLSDEQFETIYSALYPFVEDEIVEEPVVEELPEVVEDEVIM